MTEAKWLLFERDTEAERGKTQVWIVRAKKNREALGAVEWDSSWRKYVFWPDGTSVYEQDCLRDIAEFVERLTREHYAEIKARKEKHGAAAPYLPR